MDIINARLTASQNGDRWTLVTSVTETFTPQEISAGWEFEDWASVWEWDDSDHDFITNFGVTRFRPASLRESFSWTWSNVPGDVLDTELGGEEIRVQVFLRNFSTGSAAIHRFTPILQISPG
ncbi:hypothetical protein [Saccharothrix hoggarensis]